MNITIDQANEINSSSIFHHDLRLSRSILEVQLSLKPVIEGVTRHALVRAQFDDAVFKKSKSVVTGFCGFVDQSEASKRN